MRTTKRFTALVLARFHKQGRGKGTFKRYSAWHQVTRGELRQSGNLNRLFEEAIATHGSKRSTVLSLWSMLCRRGFDASSLYPRRSTCSR